MKAEHRCDGGQHDRPQALAGGTENGLHCIHRIFPQPLIGVDQNDRVVHDDTRKRDDARPRHDDREGVTRDDHADEDADGGKDHGRERQHGMMEAVELRQQDDEHEEQRADQRAA